MEKIFKALGFELKFATGAASIQSRRIQALSCEYTRHGAQDTLACWQDRCPIPPQDPP